MLSHMPDGQRWQVGEDVNGFNQPALGILRDMWDPTNFGQPDKTTVAELLLWFGRQRRRSRQQRRAKPRLRDAG